MTNTGHLLWIGSIKIQIFTNIGIISVRGCWGQPMLLFWKKRLLRLKCPNLLNVLLPFKKKFRSIFVGHLKLQSMSYRVDTPSSWHTLYGMETFRGQWLLVDTFFQNGRIFVDILKRWILVDTFWWILVDTFVHQNSSFSIIRPSCPREVCNPPVQATGRSWTRL